MDGQIERTLLVALRQKGEAVSEIRGFATAMTKQIFGGGSGEVIAMARSNLRNVPRP